MMHYVICDCGKTVEVESVKPFGPPPSDAVCDHPPCVEEREGKERAKELIANACATLRDKITEIRAEAPEKTTPKIGRFF